MAILKLTLTHDMIMLIEHFSITEGAVPGSKAASFCPDTAGIYGGSYCLEDMARILGIYDMRIEGTEEDPQGVQFPKDIEDRLWDMHNYIMAHLRDIEEVLHQFCARGGLRPGTYKCKSNVRIWEKYDD